MQNGSHPFYPQLLMIDGYGILHPQGFGSACHLGVLANLPTIGIGKNLHHVDGLTNARVRELMEAEENLNSDFISLIGDSGNILGAAINSSRGSFKSIFVSVGHRVSLASAVEVVRRTCKYRVPEPIRQISRFGETACSFPESRSCKCFSRAMIYDGNTDCECEKEVVKLKELEKLPDEVKSSLPQWLQNAKPKDQSQVKDQEMDIKQKIQDLQKKWNDNCLRVHPNYNKSPRCDRVVPMAMSVPLTGGYKLNMLLRQN